MIEGKRMEKDNKREKGSENKGGGEQTKRLRGRCK